jgi:hypothetical protein
MGYYGSNDDTTETTDALETNEVDSDDVGDGVKQASDQDSE